MTTLTRTTLRRLYRWFGVCVHPSTALEVMHFSQKHDGRYVDELTCGYLCNICMAAVPVPMCQRDGCPHFVEKERDMWRRAYYETGCLRDEYAIKLDTLRRETGKRAF
jgi:hypothetical protein